MPRALLRARSSVGCWDVETLHPSPREAQPGGQGAGARKGGGGVSAWGGECGAGRPSNKGGTGHPESQQVKVVSMHRWAQGIAGRGRSISQGPWPWSPRPAGQPQEVGLARVQRAGKGSRGLEESADAGPGELCRPH